MPITPDTALRRAARARGLRYCSLCRSEREQSEFGVNLSQPDGLNYYCRPCFARKSRDYARVRRGWVSGTPFEDKRCRKTGLKKWLTVRLCKRCKRSLGPAKSSIRYCGSCRVRNRKKLNNAKAEKALQKFLSDPVYREYVRSRRRAAKKTPHARAYAARHRAKRDAAKRGVFAEVVDRVKVWERDSGICYLCGEQARMDDFHLDHMIPLARGGSHTVLNCKVAHPRCNTSKIDKTPLEFWMSAGWRRAV